ncbi:MAG TPA: hypothetical protein VNI57_01400 [Candidatus Saccharimonadales bacterium]|nr:hypothetical protein [Candidatus Saccharimonadales bacterium]
MNIDEVNEKRRLKMREYQRRFLARHPNYYRDRYLAKKAGETHLVREKPARLTQDKIAQRRAVRDENARRFRGPRVNVGGRRSVSPEERKRIGKRMRVFWQEWRKRHGSSMPKNYRFRTPEQRAETRARSVDRAVHGGLFNRAVAPGTCLACGQPYQDREGGRICPECLSRGDAVRRRAAERQRRHRALESVI